MKSGLRQPGLRPLTLLVIFLTTMAIEAAGSMHVSHSTIPVSLGATLDKVLTKVDGNLAQVISSIAEAVSDISWSLRTLDFDQNHAGSTNSFGDDQLQADLHADELIFKHLRNCAAVESASSEEQSDILPMQGHGYTVAFDPLDGSSIFDANFAVGTIFGIWPGSTPLGQTGRQQAAAAYSVYGPRTLLIVAVPFKSRTSAVAPEPAGVECTVSSSHQGQCPTVHQQQQHQIPAETFEVLEFVLNEKDWQLRSVHTKLSDKNNVAPANIRAAAGNAAYQSLLNEWISSGCKLRYSGGMVPDVHHILAKGGGVFCNPKSATAPAKLRLLYECAPLALIVEAAGGVSHDGEQSILDLVISDTGARTIIALGSEQQVEQCLAAMRGA